MQSFGAIVRTVLLVERDSQVLEGLKRSLRVFAKSWEVVAAPTEAQMYARLDDVELSAVIIDARSCDDIEATLHTLKARYPRVVRAVLAGPEVRSDVAARLTLLAHQVIRKPAVPAQLFDLVDRGCALMEAMGSGRLQVVLGRLGALPALPATYAQLSELAANPDATLDEMAQVVERDPAITANVLKIINSAYFGLPRRVASVRETVRYLGVQPLKNIVLTVEVFEGVGGGKSTHALQQAALSRACAMREVLGRTPLAELAFAAGILADVGQLLLQTRLPLDAQAAVNEARMTGRPRSEVERERLGVSHAEIGAALLGQWNLPTALVEAVGLHHQPSEHAPAPNVACALALVCALEEQAEVEGDRKQELSQVVTRLAEVFPTMNLQAVKRQFGLAESSVA